jgi:3'(2'), 5'-bisphosphate nucleotidase
VIDISLLFPAVRQAVDLIRRIREDLPTYSTKSANDPVTIADYAAQALLLRAFGDIFPKDAILAEEHSEQFLQLVEPKLRQKIVVLLSDILSQHVSENDILRWLDHGRTGNRERRWTVDPIDGTRGYVSGRRYSVAIGLLVDHQPIEGLLACPVYPDSGGAGYLFYTGLDAAYAEPLNGGPAKRIVTSTQTDPAKMRVVISRDDMEVDSALLAPVFIAAGIPASPTDYVDGQDKYAMVASGDVDCYVRPVRPHERPQSIWDHAPGVALVRAAGGIVTDLEGNPLDFSRGHTLPTIGLIAAGKHAHRRILESVRTHLNTGGSRQFE